MGLELRTVGTVEAFNEAAEAWEKAAGSREGQRGSEIVVDALFGTGLKAAPRSPADRVIAWINRREHAKVVSIDLPSGLNCDTGRPFDESCCVRASLTVTLVGLKAGFLELDAQSYLGEVVVGDVGGPRELCERLGRRVDIEPPMEAVEPGLSHHAWRRDGS